jgi:NADPH-dependent 2,4-dienoyl-CoA reductase/sulfur reductase-like enzyme
MEQVDLGVIGAGPAGMAAATIAATAGLSVVVLDEQPAMGGQIYRAVASGGAARADILGKDYLEGAGLAQDLQASTARHLTEAVVWDIAPQEGGVAITYSHKGIPARIEAKRLLLATGALERPVPLPGWTLPGVMTAGAGQILLKASGMVAPRAVLAGSGPLLYLLAVQMARAGSPPLALIETPSLRDQLAAAPRLAGGIRGWRTVIKGLGLLADLRRHGIRRITGARDLEVIGTGRAEGLRFSAQARAQEIACDTVLLHQGVVPNTQASRALGLAHDWHAGQRAFVPRTDGWGESSHPGIFIAGDGAGIAGAKAAAVAGQLAGLQIACQLGALDRAARDAKAQPARKTLDAERSIRPFLEAAYPVAAQILCPADKTLVCRCEEVTAGDVRHWAGLGCKGPNQTKAFGRVGMGPCQGRYCGLTVTEILSHSHNLPHSQIGAYRIRMPLKPVTLGELSTVNAPEDAEEGHPK